MSISHLLSNQAELQPDAEALRWPQGAFTFSQLDEVVNTVARRLVAAQVKPRDIVFVTLPRELDWICSLALLRLGAIGISSQWAGPALDGVCDHHLVGQSSSFRKNVSGANRIEISAYDLLPFGDRGPEIEAYEYRPGELARLVATSGTAGTPKLVAYSHDALFQKITSKSNHWASDVAEFNIMPIGVMGGLTTGLSNLSRGTCFFTGEQTDESFIPFIVGAGIQKLIGSPFQVQDFLSFLQSRSLKIPTLASVLLAGAQPSKRLIQYIQSQYDVQINSVYGLTEVGAVFSKESIDSQSIGDLGNLIPGAKAKIVRTDGTTADEGEEGILAVITDSMLQGYLDSSGSLSVATVDGWFITQDWAVEHDGSFSFSSRSSDLLNIGGTQIAANEFEKDLNELDQVQGLALTEIEDRNGKPMLALAFVADGYFDPQVLNEAFQQRFKLLPKILVKVKVIPRNAMGKIDRSQLAFDINSALESQSSI